MANIMSQVKLKNKTSRNGFDLSRKNAFTAKIGELLPVACIECIPGDKIRGRVQHFTRTMPVNTAAYTRIREYYDWFFVPTNLLWNKFNTFVSQMVDNNQHATGITSSQVLTNQHPYFTSSQLEMYLATLSNSGASDLNIFNYSRSKLSAKLLHYLGYGDYFANTTGSVQTHRLNVNLNPFPLLAYQKIYQDFFRNSQWEEAYAPAFNIDYISGSSDSLNIPISELSSLHVQSMFDLRYCNWNKDLFMGLLPNSQYGDSASIIADDNLAWSEANFYTPLLLANSNNELVPNSTNQYPVFLGDSLGTTDGKFINRVNINKFNSTTTSNSSSYVTNLELTLQKSQLASLARSLGVGTGFSILALRQAEALQKWKEITQSQQQDYKSQIEAHFGVSVSDAYSERCHYVDGSVSNLDISEVVNNNITGDNGADIAGKGVGVGDGSVNFSSDVHGYLMCIYHAVPLLDYARDGVHRSNLKTMVTDYAIPEFDATGMVSVPTVELSNAKTDFDFPELLGYAPRYYDYKTAVDEVHGGFYNGTDDLQNWVAPIDKDYISLYFDYVHNTGVDSLSWLWFKVNPSVMNPIFAYQVTNDYTNNPYGIDDDQLLVNASFELSAVRNLDRNGLPY